MSMSARKVALMAMEVGCLGNRLVVAGVEQLSSSASASSLERFVEASLVVSVFDDKPDCATSQFFLLTPLISKQQTAAMLTDYENDFFFEEDKM